MTNDLETIKKQASPPVLAAETAARAAYATRKITTAKTKNKKVKGCGLMTAPCRSFTIF